MLKEASKKTFGRVEIDWSKQVYGQRVDHSLIPYWENIVYPVWISFLTPNVRYSVNESLLFGNRLLYADAWFNDNNIRSYVQEGLCSYCIP